MGRSLVNYRHKEKTGNLVHCPKYSGKSEDEALYLSVIEEVSLRVQRGVYADRLVEEDNLIVYIAQLAIRVWEIENLKKNNQQKEENGGTFL